MKLNVDELIRTASSRLGMPEDDLRSAVKNGNIAEIRKYLSGSDAQKLDNALKDRRLADELKKKYM